MGAQQSYTTGANYTSLSTLGNQISVINTMYAHVTIKEESETPEIAKEKIP